MYRILLILGGLIVLLVVFFLLSGRHAGGPGYSTTPLEITFHDLNGKPVALSSYRGKVLLVDVWATWCGYCVQEIPDLIAAQQQADRSKTPLQLLGISVDNNIADVKKFAAHQHFNYPILYKDDAQMQPFGEIVGYPTKFIINKQGVIVEKISGAMSTKDIFQHVAPYLK